MGVMVKKEHERNSDLSERITADLRKKVQESSLETPDFAKNIEYRKDTVKTSKFGWVWIVLIILAIISLIIIFTI